MKTTKTTNTTTQKGAKFSRRRFLRKALAGSAILATAPYYVPSSVLGKNAPSNRITIGCIGTGNQGIQDMRGFLQFDQVQVLAVCDVNKAGYYKYATQIRGREPARQIVNDHYASQSPSGQYHGCDAYIDFRDVLARDDIDAVTVVTPDHWHAVIAIQAAQAGKDIYGEKPLALTVREGQAMVHAVRHNDVIFQTGTHHRSDSMIRHTCELIRNGRIGQVKKVITSLPPHGLRKMIYPWHPQPIPDGFDYDFWLGPAPMAPYHHNRCFYTFRFVQDYSDGETTNTGAHVFDIVQWALDTEHTGPVEFEDTGSEFPHRGLYDTVSKIRFRARYANGVELVCTPDGPESLVGRFEGTKGWIELYWHRMEVSSPSVLAKPIGPDEIHLYPSSNHYQDFIHAVQTRKDPIAPVEVGHRSATICHLATIAMKMKTKFTWDPDRQCIIGNDAANRLLSKPLRAPWHL